MLTSSAKAKGRRLQQEAANLIREAFNLTPEDVRSTSMGAQGADIQLSTAAAKAFPFAVECKNQEKLNIWAAFDQAMKNSKDLSPLLIIKRNRSETLVVLELEVLLNKLKLLRS